VIQPKTSNDTNVTCNTQWWSVNWNCYTS